MVEMNSFFGTCEEGFSLWNEREKTFPILVFSHAILVCLSTSILEYNLLSLQKFPCALFSISKQRQLCE